MGKLNTLKGILKMKVQRLQRELERLQYEENKEHLITFVKLDTQISELNEVIDIIDTL
jgi:hypothetical protein